MNKSRYPIVVFIVALLVSACGSGSGSGSGSDSAQTTQSAVSTDQKTESGAESQDDEQPVKSVDTNVKQPSTAVDDIPIANEDEGTTAGVTLITLAVLANDAGLRDPPISVNVEEPMNGVAVVNADNEVEYTPAIGFFGTDVFSYTVEDADGDRSTNTISVTVNDEDGPIAVTDNVPLELGTTVLIDVQANDMGLNNLPITMEIESPPSFGSTSVSDDSIKFASASDFSCNGDSFQYRLTDANGNTDVGTVNLDVTPFEGSDSYGPGATTPCNYEPPIGIRTPWGITQTHEMYAGKAGYHDAGNGPYTHYVDNTDPTCDNGNPGTKAEPLCDIPRGTGDMPAGSVIEIHGGPYTYSEAADKRVYFYPAGTETAPVFIRGVDDGKGFPIINSTMYGATVNISGHYAILEHLRFIDQALKLGCQDAQNQCITPPPSDHIAARFIEVRNNENGRNGVTLYHNDMTLFRSHIHHNQTENRHGLFVWAGADNMTIVDNHFHHNGDNDIQYTHGAEENQANFVFIGRNLMHSTREVAVASKWVKNTVVSENVIHSYRPSNKGEQFCFDDKSTCITPTSGGPGTGIIVGADGFPQNQWILFNKIYDVPHCIRVEESLETYVVGNQCFDSFNDSDPATTASGIRLEKSSPTLEISYNTFSNVLHPILEDFQPITWDPEIHNNLIVNPAIPDGKTRPFATTWYQTEAREATSWVNNLFWNDPNGDGIIDPFVVRWTSETVVTTAAGIEDEIGTEVELITGTRIADPLLTDPANADHDLVDLSLQPSSPAIGAASDRLKTLDAIFKGIYGNDLTIIPEAWRDGTYDLGGVPFDEKR